MLDSEVICFLKWIKLQVYSWWDETAISRVDWSGQWMPLKSLGAQKHKVHNPGPLFLAGPCTKGTACASHGKQGKQEGRTCPSQDTPCLTFQPPSENTVVRCQNFLHLTQESFRRPCSSSPVKRGVDRPWEPVSFALHQGLPNRAEFSTKRLAK